MLTHWQGRREDPHRKGQKEREERSRRVAETEEEREEVEDGREREGRRTAERGENEKKNKGQGEMRTIILLRFCCNTQVAKCWCKAVLGSGYFFRHLSVSMETKNSCVNNHLPNFSSVWAFFLCLHHQAKNQRRTQWERAQGRLATLYRPGLRPQAWTQPRATELQF